MAGCPRLRYRYYHFYAAKAANLRSTVARAPEIKGERICRDGISSPSLPVPSLGSGIVGSRGSWSQFGDFSRE